MKRTEKIICLIAAIIILIIIDIFLYQKNLISYLLIATAVMIIIAIYLITYLYETKDEESIYKSTLKKIIKNNDSILIESKKFPDIKDKNVIRLTRIDDLIDAQNIIKKPIYYMNEGIDSCSFVLLDSNEVCIYILKQNNNIISPLELIIEEYEKQRKRKNDIDANLLDDLEKTIVKLNKLNLLNNTNDNKEEIKEKEEEKSNDIEII